LQSLCAHSMRRRWAAVTDRTIDIGALVNAGAQSSGTPLFTVADVHQEVKAAVQSPSARRSGAVHRQETKIAGHVPC